MKIVDSQISFSSATIIRILNALTFLLILASTAGQFLKFSFGEDYLKRLVLLVHLDHEHNIPTYFSVLLMLFAALILALIFEFNRKQKAPHVWKWAILSFGFIFMAFDEAFQVHEKFIWPFRALLGENNLGIFYFAWVIPGSIVVVAIGLFFSKFLLHLPTIVRFRFFIAATLYIGGAIGVELIGGRYAELYGEENWIYSMITTIEESLELIGLIFFIWSLLKYCEDYYPNVQIHFET